MEPPLSGVQKAPFLGDGDEISKTTKFHLIFLLLCFVSIAKTIKVFVQTQNGEEAIANG
jgi:hypothetical protein